MPYELIPSSLAAPQHRLAQLVERSVQQVGRAADRGGTERPQEGLQRRADRLRAAHDAGIGDEDVELQVIEARAGGAPHDLHPLGEPRLRDVAEHRPPTRGELRHEPDDLRLPRRHPQDARAPATQHESRVRLLHRRGRHASAVELVEPARVRDLLPGQEPADDAEGLLQAVHPDPGAVVRDPQLPVIGDPPPRAEPEVEAPAAQPVERGGLAGHEEGVTEVVREDVWTDAERQRHGRRGGQCGGRRELPVQVVGHIQGGVAELLHAGGKRGPVVGALGIVGIDRESEGLHEATVAPSKHSATVLRVLSRHGRTGLCA